MLTFDLIYASLKDENAALREAYTEQQALIQQMHDAMSNLTTLCLRGGSPLFTAEFDRLIEATTAARARLGEKT